MSSLKSRVLWEARCSTRNYKKETHGTKRSSCEAHHTYKYNKEPKLKISLTFNQ